jgi:hypothetical protein
LKKKYQNVTRSKGRKGSLIGFATKQCLQDKLLNALSLLFEHEALCGVTQSEEKTLVSGEDGSNVEASLEISDEKASAPEVRQVSIPSCSVSDENEKDTLAKTLTLFLHGLEASDNMHMKQFNDRVQSYQTLVSVLCSVVESSPLDYVDCKHEH